MEATDFGFDLEPGSRSRSEARENAATAEPGQAPVPLAANVGGSPGDAALLEFPATGRRPAPPQEFANAHRFRARLAKRAFDLIGALLLVAVLAPLWLAIALLIKADSPGPILFRQRRIGRDGKPFWMLKFRTMVDGADARKPALLHLNEAAEGLFKISDDPRITRTGRWLRCTCLDEVPQLIHVLTGKMSLVGPRPLVQDEDSQIRGVYRERLTMRPGMTGPWQVEGASAIPIHGMVLLDRYYIEEWSFWLDLKLLTRTARLVIARQGL
jgi:lipopolysaccharide/colanic/teichoic acid biosynthesis glycosyltransferase